MKSLAVTLAAVTLVAALQAQSPAPWQPRPVIIVDPRPYLSTPRPRATQHPKRHATPHPRGTHPRRRPLARPTPETFERLDTSPSPSPRPR